MREKVSHFFTVALFLLTLVLLYRLISPFLGALVGAITLGIAFYPLHHWVKKRLSFTSPTFQALFSDLIVVALIILPIFLMIWAAVAQSDRWGPIIHTWQENIAGWRDGKILDSTSGLKDLRGWVHHTFSIQPSEVRDQITKLADRILNTLGNFGTKTAAGLIASVGHIALMLFALFFVFRDGPRLYAHLETFLPLRDEQKRECKIRGLHVVTGVIRGWLFGAVVQGVMASIGYLLAGLKGWLFYGFLTGLAGLLPVVGTALVWVPLAVNSFLHGSAGAGIFLLIWGTLVVGLVDNLLRPYLVGKNSDVPFIYLFFSLLGGVEIWGAKGIILGPVLVAIAPVIFDIYRKRYVDSEMERLRTTQLFRDHEHVAETADVD